LLARFLPPHTGVRLSARTAAAKTNQLF
jgi:hypothetical protein